MAWLPMQLLACCTSTTPSIMLTRTKALALLVLAGAGCVAATARYPEPTYSQDFHPPWFCHGIDCPPYTVVKAFPDDMELRSYDAGRWVSTNVSDVSYDTAVRIGFMRLFEYISGANEGSEKVEMTAPVRVKLVAGEGPFCEDTFVVSFYLPWDYQVGGTRKAPAPSRDNVYLTATPAADYYVVEYGGWTNQEKVLKKTQELVERLDQLGEAYDASVFFAAGYDPPFRIIGRHNEVWIPAHGQGRIQPGPIGRR